MPTTNCPSCGLPRAEELLATAPCPVCGADGLPVADELSESRVAAPPSVVLPAPARTSSRFGLGLAAGLLVGTAAGAGGVLGWQARPTNSPGPELVAVAPPAADPPAPLPAAPKSPDAPATIPPPALPTAKDKPNPFRPTGPAPVVLDNPDGETRPSVRPGGHMVLSGKVRRLVVPGLHAGAVLDASQLEAGEVVVAGPVDGRARLIARAPGGTVRFRGPVEGGAVADVTARVVTFDEPIDGAGTRATVTLTGGGELTFAAVGGGARLEHRRANPGDPAPRVSAGRVTPPGVVVELP